MSKETPAGPDTAAQIEEEMRLEARQNLIAILRFLAIYIPILFCMVMVSSFLLILGCAFGFLDASIAEVYTNKFRGTYIGNFCWAVSVAYERYKDKYCESDRTMVRDD